MDTLGSVVPNQSGLVEPRISMRSDRSAGETSDGRAANPRGNPSLDRGNPSSNRRNLSVDRGNPSSDRENPPITIEETPLIRDPQGISSPATADYPMLLKVITQARSSHQEVYYKGYPTSNAILLYHDTKREVVQQCIANLMSQFHDHYEHVEVIADSYKGIFLYSSPLDLIIGRSTIKKVRSRTSNS